MFRRRRAGNENIPLDPDAAAQAAACANPRIAGLIAQWHAAAVRSGDRLAFVYARALRSVAALDAPVQTAAALQRLHGIGPGLRARIERALAAEGVALGNAPPRPASDAADAVHARARSARPRRYMPAFRSAAYAVLVALAVDADSPGSRGGMSTEALLDAAQPYCTAPLDERVVLRGGAGTGPTCLQGALRTLVKHDFVMRSASRGTIALTDAGEGLAVRLARTGEGLALTAASIEAHADASSLAETPQDAAETHIETVHVCDFDVVLLVDSREIRSRDEREGIAERLRSAHGVDKCETRALELGDFIWVARSRSSGEELVLPWIVERKRRDDLVASLRDGRFDEQKHRLRRIGFARVVYLVETARDDVDNGPSAASRVLSALIRTHVSDNIFVRETASVHESLRFLALLSRFVVSDAVERASRGLGAGSLCGLSARGVVFCREEYLQALRTHPDALPTYASYCRASAKSAQLTARDIYVRQLCTIRGLTLDRALAIAEQFPSLTALSDFLKNEDNHNAPIRALSRLVLADGRSLGSAVARRIALVLAPIQQYPPAFT